MAIFKIFETDVTTRYIFIISKVLTCNKKYIISLIDDLRKVRQLSQSRSKLRRPNGRKSRIILQVGGD